jgi:hypothetical protein
MVGQLIHGMGTATGFHTHYYCIVARAALCAGRTRWVPFDCYGSRPTGATTTIPARAPHRMGRTALAFPRSECARLRRAPPFLPGASAGEERRRSS